ncbi:hypothetical protein Nepgr_025956 [Nepenthes gracilis]|uniref:Uncharacterized protein n=1 Tax=Nepenthes gracilis TaxID=150966 RepID=A0AAD3T772_NEPGR|nr:hypothetical protein Nepgr_025956 [Nepenthes gracilis]
MGSKYSRSSRTSAPAAPADSNSPSAADRSSYLAAVQLDPELRVFDSELQDRASRVIKSVADSVEVRSLSFDSLRQVTDCSIDMNHDVVDVILKSKEDIWDNPELFGLVNEFLKYSVQMLGFFNALDKCLKRARDHQLIIRVTLRQFEEESENGFSVNASDKYVKTLQELKNFKEAGDTFSTEFFALFQSVYEQQLQMFEKLQLKKRNLDKKLKQAEVYRMVSNIIFAATFVAVIICSVVAAAVAAPAWVTALAAAASAPMGGVGKMV